MITEARELDMLGFLDIDERQPVYTEPVPVRVAEKPRDEKRPEFPTSIGEGHVRIIHDKPPVFEYIQPFSEWLSDLDMQGNVKVIGEWGRTQPLNSDALTLTPVPEGARIIGGLGTDRDFVARHSADVATSHGARTEINPFGRPTPTHDGYLAEQSARAQRPLGRLLGRSFRG